MAKKLNISVEDLRTTSETKVLESPITSGEGQMESFDGEPSFSDGKNGVMSNWKKLSKSSERMIMYMRLKKILKNFIFLVILVKFGIKKILLLILTVLMI